MTIKKARKILGKEAEKLSDDQVMEEVGTAKFLADSLLDLFTKMSPEERLKFSNKAK